MFCYVHRHATRSHRINLLLTINYYVLTHLIHINNSIIINTTHIIIIIIIIMIRLIIIISIIIIIFLL